MIAVDRIELVDREQRRARQADAAFRLAAELGHAGGVVRQGRLQDLERHELHERFTPQGLPYVALSAPSQPLHELVGPKLIPGLQRGPEPGPSRRPPPRPGVGFGVPRPDDPGFDRELLDHPGVRSALARAAETLRLPGTRPVSQARLGLWVGGNGHGTGSRFPWDGMADARVLNQHRPSAARGPAPESPAMSVRDSLLSWRDQATVYSRLGQG